MCGYHSYVSASNIGIIAELKNNFNYLGWFDI